MYVRVKVGEIEILPLIDGRLVSKLPATKPIPGPESLAWQDQHGIFTHDGALVHSLGAFLVRTKDRVVLVDAGAGEQLAGQYTPPVLDLSNRGDPLVAYLKGRGVPDDRLAQVADDLGRTELTQGQLPASMDALGVAPEEITDVVFTHLHFDHIGWASSGGGVFFPNANFHCAEADLAYFLPGSDDDWYCTQVFGSPLVRDRLSPVLDRVDTWDCDRTLIPGIDVRLASGHTPGSSVVVISSGNDRAMLLGDVIHCPLELMDDDFNLLGDHDQHLANQVRQAYARELEGGDIPVAAAHFPGLRFGRLLPGRGVRRWVFEGT